MTFAPPKLSIRYFTQTQQEWRGRVTSTHSFTAWGQHRIDDLRILGGTLPPLSAPSLSFPSAAPQGIYRREGPLDRKSHLISRAGPCARRQSPTDRGMLVAGCLRQVFWFLVRSGWLGVHSPALRMRHPGATGPTFGPGVLRRSLPDWLAASLGPSPRSTVIHLITSSPPLCKTGPVMGPLFLGCGPSSTVPDTKGLMCLSFPLKTH